MSGKVDVIKPLIMTLYTAAARQAASNDQVIQLQQRVLPELERYRRHEIDEEQIMGIVDEVMGDGWEIPATSAVQLASLGFTRP
jgi:hypothetical protein